MTLKQKQLPLPLHFYWPFLSKLMGILFALMMLCSPLWGKASSDPLSPIMQWLFVGIGVWLLLVGKGFNTELFPHSI